MKNQWHDKKKLLKKAGWKYLGMYPTLGGEIWTSPKGSYYARHELDRMPLVGIPQLIWRVNHEVS